MNQVISTWAVDYRFGLEGVELGLEDIAVLRTGAF